MDRLGARRVMLVCTIIGAIIPLLYPVAPWISALIVLQMFFGLSESMGWLGAQTMIGQYMYGKTRLRRPHELHHPHRASGLRAARRHQLGPRRAVGRLCADVAVGLRLGGVRAAAAEAAGRSGGAPPEGRRAKARALLPKASDYLTAFRLLGVPAVVIIVLLGALMHVGNAVQGSFYVAWLNDMGLTGTAIGLLGPAAAIGAALFSLLTSKLMRYIGGLWIALLSLWAGILLVCATPLFGSYFLLQMAMFLRSGANGLAQPLVITLVLRGAGRENQGKAIGLRGTANRIASIVSPLAMGAIAEAVGLEYSFYVIGALVSVVMIGIAIYLWRNPEIAKAGED